MKAQFEARNEAVWHYIATWGAGAAGLGLGYLVHPSLYVLGGLGIGLGLFTAYFFRDPARRITSDPKAIVAPADGTIVGIEEIASSPYFDGPCKRVSIFLSVFNVHINRAPFDGVVASIQYRPGAFKNAMRADTSDLNEANTVYMTTAQGGMTVRQISGLIARRIVCKVVPGEAVAKGEKFGMIKFGSRTELYLPTNTEICVKMKDKVEGGASIVGRFP